MSDIVERLRHWSHGLTYDPAVGLMHEAAAEIDRLRAERRPQWISAEERLPELDWDDMSTQVLVATADRMTWIGRYEKDEHGERWYIATTKPVVAWMPLPEPPEVK